MTTEPTHPAAGQPLPSGQVAGIAIALASILSLAFILHHPTVHAHGTDDFVAAVQQVAVVNGVVHGSLIALLGVFVFGYWGLTSRLGPDSVGGQAGLIAFIAGAIALAAAALVNGFVVADYVAQYEGASAAKRELIPHLLALAHSINQVCSRVGVLAVSVAVVLWSAALVRRPGVVCAVGVLGCAVGAALVVALVSGHLLMDVHGMIAFVVALGVWGLAVAVLLIRGRI